MLKRIHQSLISFEMKCSSFKSQKKKPKKKNPLNIILNLITLVLFLFKCFLKSVDLITSWKKCTLIVGLRSCVAGTGCGDISSAL